MFDIYDKSNSRYIYYGVIMEAVIPAGHTLSDDEVREYFGIDEGHKHWEMAHRPSRVKRYVFNKCIIPESPRYRFEYYSGNRSLDDEEE